MSADEEDLEFEEGTPWQEQANCLGVNEALFFPTRGEDTTAAKEVCRSCVVRDECLDFALANGEKYGIWGGKSERERRRMRRSRRLSRLELLADEADAAG